jgi:hypothetical protein
MSGTQPQGEVMTHVVNRRAKHERSEVNVSGILSFAVALVVLGVVIHFALALVMQRFSREEKKAQDQKPPQFALAVDVPSPHLQDDPAADLARLKAEQIGRLTTYGWVSRDAGIAHIPIDRAMDILAQTGLPKPIRPPEVEP